MSAVNVMFQVKKTKLVKNVLDMRELLSQEYIHCGGKITKKFVYNV